MPETLQREAVLFQETQRTSGSVGLFMGVAGAVIFGGAALANARLGKLQEAAPALLAGAVVFLGVNAQILYSRLETRVTTAGAVFAYRPWKTLTLAPEEIAGVGMRRFGLWDGGIGYHVGSRGVAITARTGDGVVITRPDGRTILVGTEHPDALYSALLQLQRAARGGDNA